jgi:hypothetical protein
MAPKNTLNEPPEGKGHSNVPPFCAPSDGIDFDDIPLYLDILGFPEEGEEGTRIFKQLDAPSTKRMARWLRDNGVPNPVQTGEFHVSLFEHSKLFPWDGSQAKPITVQPDEMYLERFEKGGKQMLNVALSSLELWARRETIEKSLKEHSLKVDWRMKIGHDVAGWRPSDRVFPIYFPLVFAAECSGGPPAGRELVEHALEGRARLNRLVALKIDTDDRSRREAAIQDQVLSRFNWAGFTRSVTCGASARGRGQSVGRWWGLAGGRTLGNQKVITGQAPYSRYETEVSRSPRPWKVYPQMDCDNDQYIDAARTAVHPITIIPKCET